MIAKPYRQCLFLSLSNILEGDLKHAGAREKSLSLCQSASFFVFCNGRIRHDVLRRNPCITRVGSARGICECLCIKRGRAEVRMPTNRTNGSHFDFKKPVFPMIRRDNVFRGSSVESKEDI